MTEADSRVIVFALVAVAGLIALFVYNAIKSSDVDIAAADARKRAIRERRKQLDHRGQSAAQHAARHHQTIVRHGKRRGRPY